ncbi:808_t:CDS:2 [Ambispora leptoticha]|uniref:808_t:CDS:1 n=1 Tax=Ambispora leptoticha TaxID=144679 RepID=A0A9N9FDL0_9GLOM|nr:808_t:CDS:2 [Ambispora leptoticha]
MPTYTGLQLLYISLQLLNLSLLIILIVVILNSKVYFSKWTLLQICICTFFVQASGLPALLVYGTEIQQHAYQTPICIIQQKVASFFMMPFQVLPAVLIFYLWYALVQNDGDIEKNHGRNISAVVWLLAIVQSIIQLISDSKHENWNVEVSKLYCRSSSTDDNWMIFLITLLILAFVIGLLAFHSCVLLFIHWRRFLRKQTRITATKLGQAARLVTCGFVYIGILMLALLPIMLDRSKFCPNELSPADYSGSVQGIVLYLIFGTAKSATVFLPCCYYAPPLSKVASKQTLTFPSSSAQPPSPISSPFLYTMAADNIERPAPILSFTSEHHQSPPESPFSAYNNELYPTITSDSMYTLRPSPDDENYFNYELAKIA